MKFCCKRLFHTFLLQSAARANLQVEVAWVTHKLADAAMSTQAKTLELDGKDVGCMKYRQLLVGPVTMTSASRQARVQSIQIRHHCAPYVTAYRTFCEH